MSATIPEQWPALPLAAWQETYSTLHLWTQIVGKIRMAHSPWVNHSWHVTLYVTTRGLTTGPMYHGARIFQIDFDFLAHQLIIATPNNASRQVALRPRSVADFYDELLATLSEMGLPVVLFDMPCELAECIPFAQDETHAFYDAAAAQNCWRVLLQADRLLKEFRSGYIGKCSPVHFFWGSFDIAVTRFSGKTAPMHPGGVPHLPNAVAREAYSQEVSSCGFWPGGGAIDYPAFYSYAYAEPEGFKDAHAGPEGAFYSADLHEFILPYDVVRTAENPDAVASEFLQATYAAAADLGGWNRAALERPPGFVEA